MNNLTQYVDNHYEALNYFGIDIKKEIVERVVNGEDQQTVIMEASRKSWEWFKANNNTNKMWGVNANQAYNKGGKGRFFTPKDMLVDVEGPEADLEFFLPSRLGRFLAMAEEYYLVNTLAELGAEVRMATDDEDSKTKVDIWMTYQGQDYAISVFRDTEWGRKAYKEKLGRCRREVEAKRVYFAFDKYTNNSKDIKTVQKWLNGVVEKGYYTPKAV